MSSTPSRPREAPKSPADAPESERPCLIVSSDSHIGPSVRRQLRSYCEEKYLQEFDDFADKLEAANSIDMPVEFPKVWMDMWAERAQVLGLQEPHARLRDMDNDGIAAEVIYQGGVNGDAIPFYNFNFSAYGSDEFRHLEPIGVHIYNRWLADFVSVAPGRFSAVAHISVDDIGQAVREVEWAKEAGLGGVNLPAPRKDFRPYTDPEWEPFWRACEVLDMPLSTHGGGGDADTRLTGVAANPIFQVEYHFYGRRAIWHMIFSGVFERYPNLKYVVAEQFGDWVGSLRNELDSTFRATLNEGLRKSLSMLPSEYLMRNCFVGSSFMSREEAQLGIADGLVDKLMWGSDYPHPESTWPRSLLSLRKTMADLPRDVIESYISKNAIAVYGFDYDELRTIADRVGPSWASLAEPYDGGMPVDQPVSQGFRDFGHWATDSWGNVLQSWNTRPQAQV